MVTEHSPLRLIIQPGVGPFSVAVGDFNRDGQTDLAVANSSSNTLSVFINNGNGTFAAKVDYPTGLDPRTVAVGRLQS